MTRMTTGKDVSATSMLERFGFTGDKLTARLGDLSGGERRRFQLLKLLLAEPNVLLLDEPTNDLDIDTLNVVEDFLDSWPGHPRGRLPRPLLPRARHRLGLGADGRRPDRHAARRSRPVPRAAPRSRRNGRRPRAERRPAGQRKATAGSSRRTQCAQDDRAPRQAARTDRHPRGPAERADGRAPHRPREADRALAESSVLTRRRTSSRPSGSRPPRTSSSGFRTSSSSALVSLDHSTYVGVSSRGGVTHGTTTDTVPA